MTNTAVEYSKKEYRLSSHLFRPKGSISKGKRQCSEEHIRTLTKLEGGLWIT